MKKTLTLLFTILGLGLIAKADHITGGEMYYSLLGYSNGNYQYSVTLKLYMRCNSGRQFNNPTIVSVYDKVTGELITNLTVALSSQNTISLPGNSNPCVTNPPMVCYDMGLYNFSVALPASSHGYILASQVNYRIAGINNLTPGYGFIGATYTADIPATIGTLNASSNNSAHFIGSDLVMICANNPFNYSFAATDEDGDQLRYYFCGAYISGNAGTVVAPPPPPYSFVPYGSNYSESSPLGPNVTINPNNGLITGTAPSAGVYVVTVCVNEMRNGVVIATQRKDLQIFIAPCTIAAAVLEPEYMLCKDTKTISLSNGISSPLIHSYKWTFRNNTGAVIHTSTEGTVTYTFADTGTYRVSLWINSDEQCSDSTFAYIRVYPGFVPAFNNNGICFNKPTNFTDASTTVYGTVNSWNWDFGEPGIVSDFSTLRNPVYTYPSLGLKSVQLIVTNTKGCRDTVEKIISILEKPPIILPFRDTLICLNDQLPLTALGNGVFSWGPNYNIQNANTATPLVQPLITTYYTVTLNDNGCINKDSIRVRVVDHVDLEVMADTVICQGDSARLRLQSNGLQYSWIPSANFANPSVANATCATTATTTYTIKATIGGCSTSGNIEVKTVPYPLSNAGRDTTICYGGTAQLSGTTDGISFRWSPAASLNNALSLQPVANPTVTTAYVLSSFNSLGCPKAGKDTIIVTVRPKINASAGRDTSVVVTQPLQLTATGGTTYEWFPSLYLSNNHIANPVASFNAESEGIRYRVLVYDEAKCVDSAFILVRIFKTAPSVFVPSAFTPNNDGHNDLIFPIAVGMTKIQYFNIYNRWGQLVFTTNQNLKGWDGRINGREQSADTYVWVVKALDFKGNPYMEKGTITLIR